MLLKMEHKNTVPATEQMKNSSDISFLGRPDAPFKILILGNSITRHGPKPDIGWMGDWGMAASREDKDYVHQLYAKLTADGRDVFVRVRHASDWENAIGEGPDLTDFAEEQAFAADLVIFRLGENVKTADVPYFEGAIREFMNYLCPKKSLFTTCFWRNPAKDDAIRAIAAERNSPCADIGATEDAMMALGQFEHTGVAVHPSDAGMAMIAERIFACIQ